MSFSIEKDKGYAVPVARIGVIGGGQLGLMLARASQRLGCSCVILDPLSDSPAAQAAGQQIVGGYSDPDKVRELAESCDIITFELEDLDVKPLLELEKEGVAIQPTPRVLATVQDKLTQKTFLRDAGIPTSNFIETPHPDEQVFADFGYPLVQKARRGGYDGRGVCVMKTAADYEKNLPVASLIEKFVEAEKEISVLVARNPDGECKAYPVVEMVFVEGQNVLDVLLAPARINDGIAAEAQQLGIKTVEALEGVGIFGVEMFLTKDGRLLVNEVAPRTHNSGHQSIEANVTDQFEQHVRAILNMPLGETEQLSPAAMVNLLGEPGFEGRPVIRGMNETLAIAGVSVHLYGKAVTKPYRKMGHVTVLDKDIQKALDKAEEVKQAFAIEGEHRL
ncbi:MAG: 5-(carboxyamino)imidazole ribonucleotide synthase [Gammaproteobacteria bacterium]|nr:5-(carboxyamino)imidazole ribonucleotide synthase [Gammaproteobacteria bacterium]